MRERTLERTLKELKCAFAFLVSFSISRQISNFHMSEFESTSLPRRQSLCHFKVYDSSDVTHTHTWSSRRRRSDRRRRSRPGDRRGRAPASTRKKGSPARCRRIDARAGFDRFRNHSRIHSSRIEFGSNRPCRTRRGRNCIGLGDTKDAIRSDERRSDAMATRGSRERKPPAKVRRVDRSRANEKEKGCIERTLRSSVVSCRSRLKTMMIWIDTD